MDAGEYSTAPRYYAHHGFSMHLPGEGPPQKVRLRQSDKPLKILDIFNANRFAPGSLGKRQSAIRDRKWPPLQSLWFARLGQTLLKPKGISVLSEGRREFAMRFWRRERDSNPRYGFPQTRFPSVRLQPLGHPSGQLPSVRARTIAKDGRGASRTCLPVDLAG